MIAGHLLVRITIIHILLAMTEVGKRQQRFRQVLSQRRQER